LLEATPLSLEEALRLTLQHDPILQQQRQELVAAEGNARASRGLFDTVVAIGPGGSYVREPLQPFVRDLEEQRRQRLDAVARVFGQLETGIRAQLATNQPRPPFCPNLYEVDAPVPASNRRLAARDDGFYFNPWPDGTGSFDIFNGIISTPFGDFRLTDLCRPPGAGETPASIFAELWRRLRSVGGYGLGAVIDGTSALPFEVLGGMAELSETLATRAALARDRLGPMPDVEVRQGLFVEARVDQPLRSGLRLGSTLRLSSEQHGFAGKPLDPAFGGRFTPVRFPSFVEINGDVPLGKGRGAVTATATERAAQLSLEAARETLRQQVAESLFRTVVAYVALAAAEERVAALTASLDRANTLTSLGDELIAADELAAVERGRIAGRAAIIREAYDRAIGTVITARRSLVEAMGVRVDTFTDRPHAITLLPAARPDALPPADALIAEARRERRDPLAAASLIRAARSLSDGARADLRRTVTLNVRAGFSTFYESPFARFYPDEQQPIGAPRETQSPVDYWSPTGFGRIFRGAWKPYAMVSLSVSLPFANRSARGRLEQTMAAVTTSEVDARELNRAIDTEVVRVRTSAAASAEVLQRRAETLARLQESYDATLQQLRNGDVTMLDVLITEEQLTNELLLQASDRQVYATALARLRYETGTLASYQLVGLDIESIIVRPLD
jgi:outer membrane protein TolC